MAVQIGSSTDVNTLNIPSQRKLARDSSGYYYACWHDQNTEIFLVKSANITGFTGAETPVEIVGSTGVALSGDNGFMPSIVIDGNDILHMVFRREVERETWYAQWDTSTDMTNSNNWKRADGSTVGAERLCTDNFGNIDTVAIAIESNNYPHVAWGQDDGGVFELFYRRWTGTVWNAADTQITDGSAQHCRNVSIAIDGNDDVHIAWQYNEADRSIRYAHTLDFINWVQSDDVSAITTGASGEEIIDQAAKDCHYPQIVISKHAGTLNDIWVVAVEDTDDDIMYAWYDKSAGTWTVDQDLETAGVCNLPTIGIDGRGYIYVTYEKDSNIRLARSPDSGTTWRLTTLESSGATEVQAQIEANFDEDDYFGYLFWDSTNGRVYFNRGGSNWNQKKHPMIEQRQKIERCHSNLGYIFQDADVDKGYWDKITVAALDSPKVNPMIEQKQKNCFEDIGYVFNQTCNQTENFDKITGTGINHLAKNPLIEQNGTGFKIGYTWANFCGDKGMFDKETLPAKGGGGSTLIWLNLPGK